RADNDSATANTDVRAAAASAPADGTPPPPGTTPKPGKLALGLVVPGAVALDRYLKGIPVRAHCGRTACLRRFREHAAINTGATHLAGFNLTVSRGSLG